MTEDKKPTTKLCPTCGTRVSEGAARCLVCGADLAPSAKTPQATRGVQGSRMPSVTLSLPAVIALLMLFLAIGAVLVYLAVRQKPEVVLPIQATVTLTPTVTVTPSLTPTLAPPTPTDTPQPTPTPIVYTVKAGESCGGIAAFFKISPEAIRLENNLSIECFISEGQELRIPHPTPTATALPTATSNPATQTAEACERVEYVVQEGDTLGIIAANYNVPPEAIRIYNGLPGDVVYFGTTIVIPLCARPTPVGPTATPTPPPPYAAPNLLLPANAAPFTLADDTITLQWAAVGTLRENEAYMVVVVDLTSQQTERLVDYVNDTKYIITATMRPKDSSAHIFQWNITPVRQTGSDADGNPIWEPAGASSGYRYFTWNGVAAQTPAP